MTTERAFESASTVMNAKKFRIAISNELRRFPSQRVALFLLGVNCAIAEYQSHHRMSDRARIERLQSLQQACDRCLQLALESFPLADDRSFGGARSADVDRRLLEHDRFAKAIVGVNSSIIAFQVEIDAVTARLEKRKKGRVRRGRPRADAHGLLALVAACFRKDLGGRPSSTPGGPFANICAIVSEYVHGEDAPRDLRRHVKAALDRERVTETLFYSADEGMSGSLLSNIEVLDRVITLNRARVRSTKSRRVR